MSGKRFDSKIEITTHTNAFYEVLHNFLLERVKKFGETLSGMYGAQEGLHCDLEDFLAISVSFSYSECEYVVSIFSNLSHTQQCQHFMLVLFSNLLGSTKT